MPDHLHALVGGLAPDSHFTSMMTLLRQRTAIAFARRDGEKLWQTGYWERVLRKDEDVFAVVRYIIENPVRAGLVNRVEDYPFVWALRQNAD